MATERHIGKITHYYDNIGVGVIKLTGALKVGSKIHVKGAHDDFEQIVESMQLEHKQVKSGNKGQEIAIKVDSTVHKNDQVLAIE